jgi:hypothetical protein
VRRVRQLLPAILLCAIPAYAGVTATESQGIRATLYAPDWVWKGQNLNFLIVIENSLRKPRSSTVELTVSNAEVDEFPSGQRVTAELAPESSARFAFANIATTNAAVDKTYEFTVWIQDTNEDARELGLELPANVKVIRGAVVAEGIWAAILPAAVAAAWCVVLALYFRRHAAPGAWKTPSPAVWDRPKR